MEEINREQEQKQEQIVKKEEIKPKKAKGISSTYAFYLAHKGMFERVGYN